jgi:glycosyltransferase involved in cell wall biosynthesis
MPARTSVSVVIPAFNSANYLRAAVDSALNQTVLPLEVLVINDGSSDNTQDVIKEYGSSIRGFYQRNSGPAVARNRGIAEAKGDFIAFLDADDTWTPDKIETQINYLEYHKNVNIVHTAYFNVNMLSDNLIASSKIRDEFTGNCYREFFFRNGVQMSSVVVLKECLIKVGGFDQNIRRASTEDYDLWFRIARDYEFGYVRRPLVYYRHHDANATRVAIAIREGELYVLNKALHADPQLVKLVGKREVRNRLHELHFEIGYRYHDSRNSARARKSFIEAIRLHPRNFYTWLLLFTSYFPSALVRRLRVLKASLTQKLNVTIIDT